jgi:oxygen-independent coproporphyrinogen-3 oxidase
VPEEQDKSMINVEAIQSLEEGGYVRIGLDHFAKQGDDLVKAVQAKNLHRSFIGYTAGRTHDLIGIGPSAISGFGGHYFQSIYSLDKYYEAIDAGVFPILRGTRQTKDQMIREDVILKIISNFHLEFREIESRYNIEFNVYFCKELELLEDLITDGAVELTDRFLEVTPLGRFCVRYVCMTFDQAYQEGRKHVPTSRKDDVLVEVD